jgi:phosphoglycolate phosphatase
VNVLLDLDGTLTDPREGITRCILHALAALDRPLPPVEELLHWIGPPLHDSFRDFLGGDDALARRAVGHYRERFADIGLYENAVYPGIERALDHLVARGSRLYLATAKPEVYALRIVAHFGLHSRLQGVFGSRLDGGLTDKAELIAYILDRTGADAAETVMVGDRRHDMVGARANDVRPIGVGWGYGTHRELREASASSILDAPSELATLSTSALVQGVSRQ